ncbi:unnamed protein product [Rhizophagus irregularis]|nr:unnamed protein product [Rhizophagus irregularis]
MIMIIINLEIDIIDDEQSHENGEDAESSTNTLEVNNPKYIFIPCNPNNNKPLNYAIVYYENDEDIGITAERNTIFCNRTLHWGTPGEKSCHRCGSFDYLISKCDIEPSAKPRVMNRKQKLKEFHQENNKFKKGSYANLTKQNSFEKRQQKNKSTTSSGKNIKVNQDRSTIALQNENNKRSRVDNEQLEASGSSDIENSLNKQNNEINRFSDALSTMSKNISKIMEYFTSDNNNDVNNFQGIKLLTIRPLQFNSLFNVLHPLVFEKFLKINKHYVISHDL